MHFRDLRPQRTSGALASPMWSAACEAAAVRTALSGGHVAIHSKCIF